MMLRTSPHLAWGAALAVVILPLSASTAAPKPAPVSDAWLLGKGAKKEGPPGPAVMWLDEATRLRGRATSGRAVSAGSSEAAIFLQPNDSGLGFFEKTYETGGLPMWACRMQFGNGWVPGDSISSYELTIFHSTSDDIAFGAADYAVELWDGDPYSILETVCAIGGVSAPIPGTQGIIAAVPFGTVVRGRVVLPAKVVYDCDRVWMGMRSLNGCRTTWHISGNPGSSFSAPPEVGSGNGLWLFTGCESSTLGGVCPTDTGLGVGVCCGSEGTCSVSGAACRFNSDCANGETCDGQELCDHGSATNPVLCSSTAVATASFCGDGVAEYYVADIGLPGTERGYVGSIFAATDTTMSVVPVSVDAIPDNYDPGNAPADLISLGGDEVVLGGGGHNIWLDIMIGDWDPNDTGVTLGGYQPALDAAAGFQSGTQGTLSRYTGGIPCGGCDDNAAPCFSHDDCTAGLCSGSSGPCHVTGDCPSGQICLFAALCSETATGNADCAAALGEGSCCGPPGYDLGTGTCGWTYTDRTDPRWALQGAGATLPGTDLSSIDARPGYFVVVDPPNDPEPFPAGGLYGATLAVHVPADAKGTFTIGLKPFPASSLSTGTPGGPGPPIPLLGTVPGFITVQTGRCCFNLQDLPAGGEGCIDQLQTPATCVQQPGLTRFEANATCDGTRCACDPNVQPTFDDNNACTDDSCIDGVATSVPKVCDDGLACTDDGCDPNDPTGVGCFATPVILDDGLACTNDACTEATGVTHTPVPVDDGIDCTFDFCEEPTGNIFHDDLMSVPNAYPCPTGDPVADGCPGATSNPPVSTTCTDGFCHCVRCFSGVTCSTPVCVTPDAPLPDLVPGSSGVLVTSTKNRFLSFGEAFDVCAPLQAARVTFVSLPQPFDVWNGHQLWVTNPVQVNQSAAVIQPEPGSPSFYAATLWCGGPVFASYACMGTVHVFHEGIVPGGTYRIELVSEFCATDVQSNFSPPLEITNSRSGDVIGFVTSTPPSAADGTVDVADFLGILNRFANVPGSIVKPRADLEPGCLDLVINLSDVLSSVLGFQGLPYPFVPTAGDPCASTCFNPLP